MEKSNYGSKTVHPVSETQHTGFDQVGDKIFTTSISGGITLREHFAGLAMQGLLYHSKWTPEQYAVYAVRIADELLRALES